jgi:hypothetical protein
MTMPTSEGEINQEIPDVYRRQIEWYDNHAIRYRHWYLGLEAALLILAAITAVVTTIHLWGSGRSARWGGVFARCHIGGSRDSGWDSESLLISRALAELQGDLRKAASRSQVVTGAWRRLHKCSGPAADIC